MELKAYYAIRAEKFIRSEVNQASLANGQLAFTKTGLASGTHTLVINVTGTRNIRSGSNRVDVDAIAVIL